MALISMGWPVLAASPSVEIAQDTHPLHSTNLGPPSTKTPVRRRPVQHAPLDNSDILPQEYWQRREPNGMGGRKG
jgi:hypothetical protein